MVGQIRRVSNNLPTARNSSCLSFWVAIEKACRVEGVRAVLRVVLARFGAEFDYEGELNRLSEPHVAVPFDVAEGALALARRVPTFVPVVGGGSSSPRGGADDVLVRVARRRLMGSREPCRVASIPIPLAVDSAPDEHVVRATGGPGDVGAPLPARFAAGDNQCVGENDEVHEDADSGGVPGNGPARDEQIACAMYGAPGVVACRGDPRARFSFTREQLRIPPVGLADVLWLTQPNGGGRIRLLDMPLADELFMPGRAPVTLSRLRKDKPLVLTPRVTKREGTTGFGEIRQAGERGVLVDQRGRTVYYATHVNPTFYQFVRTNRLYTRDGYLAAGRNTNYPVGSLELKSSWRIADPGEAGVFTTTAVIHPLACENGDAMCKGDDVIVDTARTEQVTVALVGLHVVGSSRTTRNSSGRPSSIRTTPRPAGRHARQLPNPVSAAAGRSTRPAPRRGPAIRGTPAPWRWT